MSADRTAPAPTAPARGAYYRRLDVPTHFVPTEHTTGGWSAAEQHISPMTGLLVHEIERTVAPDGLQVARIALDILGVLTLDPFEVTVEVLRPGRTISLVEARVAQHGRTAVIARAWRLAVTDTVAVAGGGPAPLPAPATVPAWDLTELFGGGFVASLDIRRAADAVPGSSRSWTRSRIGLVEGERASTLASWLAMVDTANGLAIRASPAEWHYPNVDLTIHLHRQPVDEWLGFETSVVFGPDGLGITSSALHDSTGPVGRVEQMVTIRPRVPAHR
ncbi:thioesterase family protein [Kitasatospora sp. NPDC051853]|uniref:thioesterase family protein n=1 Tax=Kitasatospora sp. NPDC051853 TaxID=3364058 RepID=UPI0037985F26